VGKRDDMTSDDKGLYARAREAFIRESYLLEGQWFYAQDVYRILKCDKSRYNGDGADMNADFRQAASRVLYELSRNQNPILEQSDKRYRIITTNFKKVKPHQARAKRYDLRFPRGVKDNTYFSFADTVVVHQGDVIGFGGEGNKGKSAFALNLAIENCDRYDVTLVLSENESVLDERLECVDWAEVYTEDNEDYKFEIIAEKDENRYLDIIRARKDNLVIIDWYNPIKEPWRVSEFYRDASDILVQGVGFIVQQKRSYKDFVVGGEGARDYCSLFMMIKTVNKKNAVLVVDKAKSYDEFNPEGYMYRFDTKNRGTLFSDIHEVEYCHSCKGSGYITSKGVSNECSTCWGKGIIDVGDLL
jgi:hypothetical protein